MLVYELQLKSYTEFKVMKLFLLLLYAYVKNYYLISCIFQEKDNDQQKLISKMHFILLAKNVPPADFNQLMLREVFAFGFLM